jgi:hypothetical protein
MPAILPRNHHLSTSVHSTRASHLKLQEIQVVSARKSGVIFLKKKEAHSPSQVANYGVQIIQMRSHLLHTLQIFHVP